MNSALQVCKRAWIHAGELGCESSRLMLLFTIKTCRLKLSLIFNRTLSENTHSKVQLLNWGPQLPNNFLEHMSLLSVVCFLFWNYSFLLPSINKYIVHPGPHLKSNKDLECLHLPGETAHNYFPSGHLHFVLFSPLNKLELFFDQIHFLGCVGSCET